MMTRDLLKQELLSSSVEEGNVVEPCRWWVLGVFGFSSGIQGLLWMTFSSVPSESKAYYNIGERELDIMLNEGPVAYVIVVLACTLILTSRGGLRSAVGLSCGMCLVASVIRTVPSWLANHQSGMAFLYTAQFLNAAAAPLTQAAPSLMSQIWFPASQRALATGIARQSNACGRAVGFFIGPALVTTPTALPRLLYVEIAFAAATLLGYLAYFPEGPVKAPTRSAALMAANSEADTADHSLGLLVKQAVRLCLLESRVFLLVLSFGLQMGMYGAWSGVLPSVLQSEAGGGFNKEQAGEFGSVNTFAGIGGRV